MWRALLGILLAALLALIFPASIFADTEPDTSLPPDVMVQIVEEVLTNDITPPQNVNSNDASTSQKEANSSTTTDEIIEAVLSVDPSTPDELQVSATSTTPAETIISKEELEKHLILAQGPVFSGTRPGIGLSAPINVPDYFKAAGTLRYVVVPLGYFHDGETEEVHFYIDGRDCRTPTKPISEWGIFNNSRGQAWNEVILGPFEGTDCSFTPTPPDRPWEGALAIRASNMALSPHFVAGASGGFMSITIYAEELSPVRASSVLFLPGIKGSKLYRASDECDFLFFDCDEEPLWPPAGSRDIQDLHLDIDGKSTRDVYTKKGELLSSFGSFDFYDSFITEMVSLAIANTIVEFSAIPYDWRLSLPDIIENGLEREGKIYYSQATTTPYIEQELRRLAATSHTGKVTIIAHSNGGLVAKALMQKLGDVGTSDLIDDVIFVGVPQSGAPQAIGGLLFGYGEAIPIDTCAEKTFWGFLCSFLVERGEARELAENSPMAYHLLPSPAYFADVKDTEHPIGHFTGINAYANEFIAYGETLDTFSELSRFMRAEENGRTKPERDDVKSANILNSSLLSYAETIHTSLDSWTPPADITLHQIAGWGVDTVAGIEFTEYPGPFTQWVPLYRPVFVEDGDKVVPVPSALLTTPANNVKNYWIDLPEYNQQTGLWKEHSNLLSLIDVKNLISSVLYGKEFKNDVVVVEQPETIQSQKKLRFLLHAEASVKVTDGAQNEISYQNDTLINTIPEAEYGEFGAVKYVTVPDTDTYILTVEKPQKTERAVIEVERVEKGRVKKRSTVANIPLSPNTTVTLVAPDTKEVEEESLLLKIEEDGDNAPDQEIQVPDGLLFVLPTQEDMEEVEDTTEELESAPRNSRRETSAVETVETLDTEVKIPTPELVTRVTELSLEQAETVLGTSTVAAEDLTLPIPVDESNLPEQDEKERGVLTKIGELFTVILEHMLKFLRTLFA